MSHSADRIMYEATWVFANALTECSDETLRNFTIKYFSVLAEPLANNLNRIHVVENLRLLQLTLETLYRLLIQDRTMQLSSTEGSLCFEFDKCHGSA